MPETDKKTKTEPIKIIIFIIGCSILLTAVLFYVGIAWSADRDSSDARTAASKQPIAARQAAAAQKLWQLLEYSNAVLQEINLSGWAKIADSYLPLAKLQETAELAAGANGAVFDNAEIKITDCPAQRKVQYLSSCEKQVYALTAQAGFINEQKQGAWLVYSTGLRCHPENWQQLYAALHKVMNGESTIKTGELSSALSIKALYDFALDRKQMYQIASRLMQYAGADNCRFVNYGNTVEVTGCADELAADLNICLRSNPELNKTYVYFGSPVIYIEH